MTYASSGGRSDEWSEKGKVGEINRCRGLGDIPWHVCGRGRRGDDVVSRQDASCEDEEAEEEEQRQEEFSRGWNERNWVDEDGKRGCSTEYESRERVVVVCGALGWFLLVLRTSRVWVAHCLLLRAQSSLGSEGTRVAEGSECQCTRRCSIRRPIRDGVFACDSCKLGCWPVS